MINLLFWLLALALVVVPLVRPAWTRAVLILAVSLFLLLFLGLPIMGLVLVGFTGEPINLPGLLLTLDLPGLVKELSETPPGLKYYSEFFHYPRYWQGLLNSVGVAPLAASLSWLVGLPVQAFLKPAQRKWLGLPLMGSVFLLTLLLCVALKEGNLGERLLYAFGFSPLVSLAATALGVSVAFCLTRTTMPGRHWVRLLCVVPLAIPSFLAALSFKILMGDAGIVTNLMEAVGLVHPFASQSVLSAGCVQAFLEFPLVMLTTAAALDRMDPSLGEAAEVMGARRNFTLWTVSLPVILPGISAGALLVFIRSFGDFGTLELLVPTSYRLIVLEAYRDQSGSTYWGGASMLSTLMILTILLLLALQKYFVERGSFQTVTGRSGASGGLSKSPLVRYGALLWCLAVLSVPAALLATMGLISLAAGWGAETFPTHYTFARYQHIFADLMRPNSPLVNSFKLVLPALGGALVLSFTVAYLISRSRHWSRHLLDFAVALPFVVPGVAFAVALIGAFNNPPLPLHFTVTLVIIAYIVTRMPYGVRSTLASFQQIGISMEEASKTMGAPAGLTLWKVTVPLVLPGLLAGGIMAFISMMQDVAITMMICPPKSYPAGMFVFHAITNGRIFEASAYGLVLLCLILVPYMLAYRLGGVKTSL